MPNIWNGTMFGDLDWPQSTSRGFISISWASCWLRCAVYIAMLLCVLEKTGVGYPVALPLMRGPIWHSWFSWLKADLSAGFKFNGIFASVRDQWQSSVTTYVTLINSMRHNTQIYFIQLSHTASYETKTAKRRKPNENRSSRKIRKTN